LVNVTVYRLSTKFEGTLIKSDRKDIYISIKLCSLTFHSLKNPEKKCIAVYTKILDSTTD